jgi:pilus assembly protein Flp/PilA
MLQYIRKVAERRQGDGGAASVEYGLLVAAIAAIIVLVVFALGTWVKGAFSGTCEDFAANSKAPNVKGNQCDTNLP